MKHLNKNIGKGFHQKKFLNLLKSERQIRDEKKVLVIHIYDILLYRIHKDIIQINEKKI